MMGLEVRNPDGLEGPPGAMAGRRVRGRESHLLQARQRDRPPGENEKNGISTAAAYHCMKGIVFQNAEMILENVQYNAQNLVILFTMGDKLKTFQWAQKPIETNAVMTAEDMIKPKKPPPFTFAEKRIFLFQKVNFYGILCGVLYKISFFCSGGLK